MQAYIRWMLVELFFHPNCHVFDVPTDPVSDRDYVVTPKQLVKAWYMLSNQTHTWIPVGFVLKRI